MRNRVKFTLVLMALAVVLSYIFYGHDKPYVTQPYERPEPSEQNKKDIYNLVPCHNEDGVEIECKG